MSLQPVHIDHEELCPLTAPCFFNNGNHNIEGDEWCLPCNEHCQCELIRAVRSEHAEKFANAYGEWLAFRDAANPVAAAFALSAFANAIYHYATDTLNNDDENDTP